MDSCVILSGLPRALMIEAARQNLASIWFSKSVREEVMHVASRKNILQQISVAFIELVPYANEVQKIEEHEGLWLPDENDRHVVLGALSANADTIVTENLRDFPKSALQPLGIKAESPDQFLTPLFQSGQLQGDGLDPKALKRAKLYRTAKSVG